MAKQKIVISLSMNRPKSRSKALKLVVSFSGIESLAIKDNNQVELTGKEIDAYELIKQLRKMKNVGFVELISVTAVGDEKTTSVPVPVCLNSYQYGCHPPYYMYEVRDNVYNPLCSIL